MNWRMLVLAIAAVTVANLAYMVGQSVPNQADHSAMRDGHMGMTMGAPSGAEAMQGRQMMGMSTEGRSGDGHMNSPLHRQMMTISALPELESELGLSAQQASELRRLKTDLLAKSKDTAGQIAMARKELDLLLSGDTSRTRTVKALFEKIAALRAQLQYAGFETSTKMKALLNAGQKTKFAAMKPAEIHRAMMSRGHMQEMELAMQLMGAEGGMGMPGEGMQGMGMSNMGMPNTDSSNKDTPHDAAPADPHGSHHGADSGNSSPQHDPAH